MYLSFHGCWAGPILQGVMSGREVQHSRQIKVVKRRSQCLTKLHQGSSCIYDAIRAIVLLLIWKDVCSELYRRESVGCAGKSDIRVNVTI